MNFIATTFRQLSVGDRVRVGHYDLYRDATVVKIDETFVHFVRPYVYLDPDTGIDYIGVERWTMPLEHNGTVDVCP